MWIFARIIKPESNPRKVFIVFFSFWCFHCHSQSGDNILWFCSYWHAKNDELSHWLFGKSPGFYCTSTQTRYWQKPSKQRVNFYERKKNKDELVEKYRRTAFVMDITVWLIWLVLFLKQIQLWKSFMKKPINMQLSFTFNPKWGIWSSYCQTCA